MSTADFDRASKGLGAQQAELEVNGHGPGSRIGHDRASVTGISYDARDDLVGVIFEGLDPMITKPREIWIDENAAALGNVEVVDGEGRHHIVKFRSPLALPAP